VNPAAIFIGRPAVLAPDQEALYGQWLDGLATLHLAAVTIPRSRYAASPWEQLRRVVGQADGALILGFRQIDVESGRFRPGTAEQGPAAGSYAGAWSQIEAGLAVMAGLPVLVAPQGDVREGVFAPNVWRGGLHGTRIDVWTAGDGARDHSLRQWAAAVGRRSGVSRLSATA
jgi:hypothetical protein